MEITYVPPDWGHDVESTKQRAISYYHLRDLGWKGFEALDWAAALLHNYPSIPALLIATYTGTQDSFTRLEELAKEMSPEDRHRLRDYIVGKLALEELSCRRVGAGAGSCETRAALHACVERSLKWE